MKKYYIDGKEVSALEKAQHKLKQLNEAISLLEEITDRLAWADDFAEYESIKDALDAPYSAGERAKDELEEQAMEIENQIQELEDKKGLAEAEVEQEFEQNIRYSLA
jgi:hypothetical protein